MCFGALQCGLNYLLQRLEALFNEKRERKGSIFGISIGTAGALTTELAAVLYRENDRNLFVNRTESVCGYYLIIERVQSN